MSTPPPGSQPTPADDDRDPDDDRNDHRRLIDAIDDPEVMRAELDELLSDAPAAFLGFVSRTVMACPICADLFIAEIGWDAPRPLRGIATAASYLQARSGVEIIGIDLPPWLMRLDDAHITEVRQRTEPDGHVSWLVEARMPGNHLVAARLAVEPGVGALNGAMVCDGTAGELALLCRATEPGSRPAHEPVDLSWAATELVVALGRYRASLGDPQPGNPWPANEPLVTWLIATLLHQADPRTRAAA